MGIPQESDSRALMAELLAQESRVWQRMGTTDPESEARFAPDFISIDARGVGLIDRDETLALMKKVTASEFRISDARLRKPTPDTALLTYRVDASAMLDGKVLPWHALSTALWVLRGGTWMKVFYQSTRIPDPS